VAEENRHENKHILRRNIDLWRGRKTRMVDRSRETKRFVVITGMTREMKRIRKKRIGPFDHFENE
jgi:hypothetical protein